MSQDAGAEMDVREQGVRRIMEKQAFLKSCEVSARMIEGLGLSGFQLGGGAVDFALGRYRRVHEDVDMVYVVNSRNWDDYLANPEGIPDERIRLQSAGHEPGLWELSRAVVPLAMERMGVPGVRMEGGDFPIRTDFLEGYKHAENGEEYVMLPIYGGSSYIKIPLSEIGEREVDGVATWVPSIEMQLIMKEQCASVLERFKGGLLPDWRRKAGRDMQELREVADPARTEELRKKGVGFRFSLAATAGFRATRLLRAIAGFLS